MNLKFIASPSQCASTETTTPQKIATGLDHLRELRVFSALVSLPWPSAQTHCSTAPSLTLLKGHTSGYSTDQNMATAAVPVALQVRERNPFSEGPEHPKCPNHPKAKAPKVETNCHQIWKFINS